MTDTRKEFEQFVVMDWMLKRYYPHQSHKELLAELVKALEPIGQRFLSGNDVPVSRATVPAEEWKAVQDVLAKAKEMMG